MAKLRRADEQPPAPNVALAVVRHQKLCLLVDMPKHRLFGWTELRVVEPENGVVGLHAGNLNLESVKVDGETVEFDYYPVQRRLGDESRWAAVTCPNSAADAAASVNMSSLAHEMDANLIVYYGTSPKPENKPENSPGVAVAGLERAYIARECLSSPN